MLRDAKRDLQNLEKNLKTSLSSPVKWLTLLLLFINLSLTFECTRLFYNYC